MRIVYDVYAFVFIYSNSFFSRSRPLFNNPIKANSSRILMLSLSTFLFQASLMIQTLQATDDLPHSIYYYYY